MGRFEPVAKPWGMGGIPADFSFSLLPEDWEHFQVLMEQALIRITALQTAPTRAPRARAAPPPRQRPGELHARWAISPGRGARVPQLFRRGRLQLDRDRVGGG